MTAIRNAVIAHSATEEIGLLGLRYHSDGTILPAVDICPRPLAEALARTGDPTVTLNPAEWQRPALSIRLAESDAARCDELERWAQQNDESDVARVVALEAAARLRAMPWSEARTVSENLFVFAVDFDLQHLEQDVLPDAPSYLTGNSSSVPRQG